MESTPVPAAAKKLSPSERLKALLAEWGPLFVVVWFVVFATVLVGFVLAIQFGFRAESTAGTLGTWGAAYLATQVTKPLRIAATLVITPALGALLKRFRRPATALTAPEPQQPQHPADTQAAPAALDETPSGQR